jgi:hypothetical protein
MIIKSSNRSPKDDSVPSGPILYGNNTGNPVKLPTRAPRGLLPTLGGGILQLDSSSAAGRPREYS